MKAPFLLAAVLATLGFSVPAFADCGANHPQASASSAVVAQSSNSNMSQPAADDGNQQQSKQN